LRHPGPRRSLRRVPLRLGSLRRLPLLVRVVVSLVGKVRPAGGIKEKVLAAHPTGIRSVILPRLNARDVEDVPEELRKQVRFIFVDDAEEVLRHALTPSADRREPKSMAK